MPKGRSQGVMKGVCSPHAWLTPAALRSLNLFLREDALLSPPNPRPAFRGGAVGEAPCPWRGRAPGVPGAPRRGRTPSTERRRAGLGSPAQAAGAVPATPLPPDFPSSTHQAGLRSFPDFYLILLLKLWRYLQWQWYRPAQDPLKQICLQVKSKKYFDS